MTARSAVLTVTTGALLAVAGCGGGSGAAARRQASSTPAATPAPAAAGGPRTVRIADFAYQPGRVVVRRGTRVRWVNRDVANHTVTFEGGPGDLGNLDRGQRRGTRFTRAGTYRYVCQYHPNMHGTVVVR